MYNVKDMYNVTKQREVPLLSNYNSAFWTYYTTYFSEFDNVFKTLFKTFQYFDQEDDETILEVTNNFIEIVKNWLRMNDKRYNELWRVNVVDDSKYGLLDDVDMKEQYQGLNTIASETKEGARSDVVDFTEGSQNSENQNRIAAFNTNDYATKNSLKNAIGTRNDVTDFTKGEMDTTFAKNEGDQHVLTRVGNNGVRTKAEILDKHTNYWKKYNFYMFVFSEIQEQFLILE
jgi:hypothetical protein